MTFTEAFSLMWHGHVNQAVREMHRIELQPWTPQEKRRQQRLIFECAMDEFMRRGWVTTEHFMELNRNCKLQEQVSEGVNRVDLTQHTGRVARTPASLTSTGKGAA